MMKEWNGRELKETARTRLHVNYWKAVFVGVLVLVATSGVAFIQNAFNSPTIAEGAGFGALSGLSHSKQTLWSMITLFGTIGCITIASLVRFFFLNPLEIGCDRFFYHDLTEDADVKEVCYTYDKGYWNGVRVLFFRDLYITLWSMLLIVPGIIKAYEYRMVPYILSENPHLEKDEVFALSKEMMRGNIWKTIKLDLSFILWHILGAMTLGIVSILYVTPYRNLAVAGLYRELRTPNASGNDHSATDIY